MLAAAVQLSHALFLGALQGFTEFLPISSSGHLALAELFFGIRAPARDLQGFEVLLHAGTLFALLVFYRRVWGRLARAMLSARDRHARRVLLLLFAATAPGAVAGALLADAFEAMRSPTALAAGFVFSAIVLLLARTCDGVAPTLREEEEEIIRVTPLQALLIGMAQAFALVPSVSRSAVTASAGCAVGLDRRSSLDFSFLIAMPIIAGAVVWMLLGSVGQTLVLPPLSVSCAGFLAAFGSSLLAIIFLRVFVARRSLAFFALYLLPLAGVILWREWHIGEWWRAQDVEAAVRHFGAAAVFLFAFVETLPGIGFFSPGMLALALAGSLAPSWIVAGSFLLAAAAGAGAGNALMFVLGQRYGRRLAARVHLSHERLIAADRFMARFGRLSVFVAQFAGFARPAVAFLAGEARLSRRDFTLWMLTGVAIWAGLAIIGGYLLRSSIVWLLSSLAAVGWMAVLIAVIAAIVANRSRSRSSCPRAPHS